MSADEVALEVAAEGGIGLVAPTAAAGTARPAIDHSAHIKLP